jgi:hypothetical protein
MRMEAGVVRNGADETGHRRQLPWRRGSCAEVGRGAPARWGSCRLAIPTDRVRDGEGSSGEVAKIPTTMAGGEGSAEPVLIQRRRRRTGGGASQHSAGRGVVRLGSSGPVAGLLD